MESELSADQVRHAVLRRSYWTGNYRAIDVDYLLARVVIELERREAEEQLPILAGLVADAEETLSLPAAGRRRRESEVIATGRRRRE